MTLTAFVLPKLRNLKTRVDKCLKNLIPEDPSTSNMINVTKHCWNLNHSNLIVFIDHCKRTRVGKSLSYWHVKSWDCLLNSLATDKKYFAHHRDNLMIQSQTQFSQKQKSFSEFFAAFLKSTLIFKHLENKDDPHRFCVFEVTDSKIVVV